MREGGRRKEEGVKRSKDAGFSGLLLWPCDFSAELPKKETREEGRMFSVSLKCRLGVIRRQVKGTLCVCACVQCGRVQSEASGVFHAKFASVNVRVPFKKVAQRTC